MKATIRNLIDGIPFCPVPVRLRSSSIGAVDFWWSKLGAEIDIAPSGMIYRGGESSDLAFMKRYLQRGMSYVDVGAYHGLYAVVAGRKVGRGGTVVLFEPSRPACRRARINLVLNRVSARIENMAVTERCGEVVYHQVVDGFETMGALRPPASRDPVRTRRVTAVSLDAYCRANAVPGIDLLKVDAEGAELSVFAGAGQVLGRLRPIVICEVLDWVTEPWGYEANRIIEALRDHGYCWYDIESDGRLTGHAERATYRELRNYLAVPREKVESLRSIMGEKN